LWIAIIVVELDKIYYPIQICTIFPFEAQMVLTLWAKYYIWDVENLFDITPHGNHSIKPTSTPSTSNTCNFFTAKPMMLNFCEELLHLAN
jgi:hypothetical protein